MQISIIIPIYKVEKYLRECLESIKTQNFQDYEVLMINDGSPDNSEVICKEFAAGDARFKYIRQENQGVSAARNKGLSQARGKYVYLWIRTTPSALIFWKLCIMRPKPAVLISF